MHADRLHPEPGTPYAPSRSTGHWQRALILCVVGGLISGLLYALCLMMGPVRWSWTTPGRNPGGIPGIAALVCALPAAGFGIVGIALGRIGARWLVRSLSILIGLVVGATCFVALVGQAPLGSDALLAKRPVDFRAVSLGQGAWEAVSQPSRLGGRLQGLRAVASDDKALFAGVLLGALICAGFAAEWSFRGARRLTGGFMLDDRTGAWFSTPRDLVALEPLEGRDPTYTDLAHLQPIDDEEREIRRGRVLVLRVHESDEVPDRELALVSLVEWSLRRRGFLRRKRPVMRVVMPPTFVETGLIERLIADRR